MTGKSRIPEGERELLDYLKGYFSEGKRRGLTTQEVASELVLNEDTTRRRLTRLLNRGLVRRVRRGKFYWEVPRRRRR